MMSMNLKEKGFTLLELMIAMVVLAIGILALIQMQVAAMSGNSSANQMTTAVTLAQDQIERLKGLSFFDNALADTVSNNATLNNPPNTGSIDHADASNPINESGGTTGLRRYYRFWNIADNTPISGVKTVVVCVYWGTVDGGTGLTQHRVIMPTTIGQ
jgi:type IV pilus modification protein PilV